MTTSTVLGYIGSDSGIDLVGALFGAVMALVGALIMVALWPARILWKRFKQRQASAAGQK